MAVVTEQPGSFATPKELYKNGPIMIRNLMDTEEDCNLSARLVVETFRDKFIHATSESRLPALMDYTAKYYRGRQQEFYERDFIAEYEGERAGCCGLRYQGDKERFPERETDIPTGLGCCDMCGLMCLDMATVESSISADKCYVDHICVDQKFRSKGIGKAFLDVAEQDARKKGCKAMYLWVAWTNRAQNLYKRQGYVITTTKTCCLKCMIGERKAARMEKPLN